MMRKFFLFFLGLMLSVLSAYSQTKYTDTEYGLDGSIRKSCSFNEIDSVWTCIHYYQNGQISEIEKLANDGFTSNGPKIGFNPNGNIAYSFTYKKGILFGAYVEFFPDGATKKTGQFYNGFMTGEWKEFNESGKLMSTTKYIMTKSDSTYTYIEGDDRVVMLKIRYGQPIKIVLKNKTETVNAPITIIFPALEPKNKR